MQHTMRVNSLSILRDDVHAITCGEDCSVKATDLSTGASRAQWQLAVGPRALAVGQDQVNVRRLVCAIGIQNVQGTVVTGYWLKRTSIWTRSGCSGCWLLAQEHWPWDKTRCAFVGFSSRLRSQASRTLWQRPLGQEHWP
eukprot:scaffold74442_cov19-Tisochrysis_lutea.AAC.1